MSVIRWCMPFGDGVHGARAMHVHSVFAQAPSPSANPLPIDLKHSYIYDFGPRQCNQAVPASSPKS